MGHDHAHGMSAGGRHRSRLLVVLGITLVVLVVEVVGSWLTGSLALLADAGHMLTDLVALFMGLAAVTLARRGSTSAARTYGWHRAEVFTAVANAALLIAMAAFIFYEAVERLGDAPAVPGVPMIVVALAIMALFLVVARALSGYRATPQAMPAE